MGNINSNGIDPVHLRIYSNILQIESPQKKVQMINTCLAAMEYVTSAKRAGVYSYLLNYVSTVNSGHTPPLLPGEQHGSTKNMGQHSVQTSYTNVPRSLQTPNQIHSHPGLSTHPSLINAGNRQVQQHSQTQLTHYDDNTPSWKVVANTPKQKAMTYFASCLEVLGIQEEVALTEESLKSAYKKVALKAHPDKGGSEEYFEAVTRAYAYLSEILKQIKGGRKNINGTVEAPSMLNSSRNQDAEKWKHVEPVRLNAKNLDMNAFNKLFEETHIPDPDKDGYGDWLKSSDNSSGGNAPKFSGKFNRDVFNQMFEDEAKKGRQGSSDIIFHPGQMALTLNPTSGVELAGERPSTFTAAPNSKMQFTDLRGAYTTENTISEKVANVHVGERKLDQYRAQREKAPDPFTSSELHRIQEFEAHQRRQEELRERRKAEMSIQHQQYFDRMKQLVITDGIKQQ